MIRLIPDRDTVVQKIRIGRVPALILNSASVPRIPIAVLWIHGGGYALGMKEMAYYSRAVDLMKKFGVTVISPGYRLSWQKPYPAAVDDCFEVLRYIDENKKKLGIERIMVGGESAGGGLCAALCMMARDKGIHVAYQMPLYPMLDNFDTESSVDNHGRIWNTRKNHLGWRLYLRNECKKEVSPYASPSRQKDYSNLPPCYTFVGDGEPFHAETLKYVENLKNAGGEAEVDVYHTDVHNFDEFCGHKDFALEAKRKFLEKFRYALENYF